MTRLALSHWILIGCSDKWGPQKMHVNISSLATISNSYHFDGYCHCSHWDPITAAQPQIPAASFWAQKSGCDEIEGCQRILELFQEYRKLCHQKRLDWNALYNQEMKHISSSFAAIEYILETKTLPGCTTFVECWRVPTSNRICLLLDFFLGSHVFNKSWILASLFDGNLISMWYIVRVQMIPKMIEMLKGPPFRWL